MNRKQWQKKVEKAIKIGLLVFFALLLLPSLTLCALGDGTNTDNQQDDAEYGQAGEDFSYENIVPTGDVGFQYQSKGLYTVGVELKNTNSTYTLCSATVQFTAYNENNQVVGEQSETARLPINPGETFYVGGKLKNCTDAISYVKAEIKKKDTSWYSNKSFTYNNPLTVDNITPDGTGNYEATITNAGNAYINEGIVIQATYIKDGTPIYVAEWSGISFEGEAGESHTFSTDNRKQSVIPDHDEIIIRAYKKPYIKDPYSGFKSILPWNWGKSTEEIQNA